jgi:hypothetical protein
MSTRKRVETPVDRSVIRAPFGIRKRLALYDLIGNKMEAERGSDWLVKGTPRRKTEE